MQSTSLGSTGLTVPVQGLGLMRLTEPDPPVAESDAVAVIHRALDRGVRMLDTSDLYGRGLNEELLARALRGRREETVLATKFGVAFHGDGEDDWSLRGDPEFVRASCEASLRRLDTDVIDLFYLSRPKVDVPLEETVGAMADLVTEGKVRHLGLCEVSGDELRRAHAVHPIAAVQSEWSLLARRIESMVAVCVELGVGVVPFSPTAHGLLTTGRNATTLFTPDLSRMSDIEKALNVLADRHGVRAGQVALAWVHHRARVWGTGVVPVPGTARTRHLDENVAAADLVLDDDELATLDEASRPVPD